MDAVEPRAVIKATATTHQRPTEFSLDDLKRALAVVDEGSAALPLKRSEVNLDGAGSKIVEDTLRPIGAAVDPRLPVDHAKAWRKALLMKLSDLPAAVIVKATRRAMHTPFRFLADVEVEIRNQANLIREEQRIARVRLARWIRETEQALNPPLALPPREEPPVTQDEVDRLNAQMRSCGIATRFKIEGDEIVVVSGTPDPSPE